MSDENPGEGTAPADWSGHSWNEWPVELRQKSAASQALFWAENRKISNEQAVSLSKWLTATLVAINGTGLITVVNAADKLGNAPIESWTFISGLMLAMLNGWMNQWLGFKYEPVYNHYFEYWTYTEIVTERSFADERALADRFKWVPRLAAISSGIGWLSAFAFLGGCALVTVDLSQAKKPAGIEMKIELR